MKRIVITGADGLIGWHVHARMHAYNCAALFRKKQKLFDIVALNHTAFDDDVLLNKALIGAHAVLHFAGVNRASDNEIEAANISIAKRLVKACNLAQVSPHIIYANSIQAVRDTAYGRSKRKAGNILSKISNKYSDLILPHIFGEFARPNYNNVTATFADAVISSNQPDINPNGSVNLLYVGDVAQLVIDAVINGHYGQIAPAGRQTSVVDLYNLLSEFHANYMQNIFPSFENSFSVNLFNVYRSLLYPFFFPRSLNLNTDSRGNLFEAVKGGGGGQSFMSTTFPGITRGNHFHLGKVERFLVLQGEAIIRIRKILTDKVDEFRVSGASPSFVDIPSLHTHSIENVGKENLLTFFWTNELFNAENPDTFADEVIQ
jgi:UDP-2-acetamido-2,6-beta-L-arabino-hexul-4-ose reductase